MLFENYLLFIVATGEEVEAGPSALPFPNELLVVAISGGDLVPDEVPEFGTACKGSPPSDTP